MVHSRVAERPRPGKRKPIMGDRYSQATASAHSASRVSSCDRPPAIHRTADTHSQASMRRKLGERMRRPQVQHDEQRAAHLDHHVADGEHQPGGAEGAEQGGARDQAGQHHGEQHHAHGHGVGVEPVRDPAGVLPAQPHGEPQDQRVQRAHQGQVVQQAVGDLGDREDVHQVEEQLDEGDAGFVAVAAAQQVGACEKGHEEAAWLWWRSQISAAHPRRTVKLCKVRPGVAATPRPPRLSAWAACRRPAAPAHGCACAPARR